MSIRETLQENIWEVFIGVVGILAIVFHDWLGVYWVLVLVVSVVAIIAGVLSHSTRWFPFVTFISGAALAGLIVGGVLISNFEVRASVSDRVSVDGSSTALTGGEAGNVEEVLPPTWLGEDQAVTVAEGAVIIACTYIYETLEAAALKVSPISELSSYPFMSVGEIFEFSGGGRRFYLALLDVVEGRILISVAAVPESAHSTDSRTDD